MASSGEAGDSGTLSPGSISGIGEPLILFSWLLVGLELLLDCEDNGALEPSDRVRWRSPRVDRSDSSLASCLCGVDVNVGELGKSKLVENLVS